MSENGRLKFLHYL